MTSAAAIDKLLAVAKWDEEPVDENGDEPQGGPLRWQVVISEVKRAMQHERLMAKLKAEHPELWADDDASGVTTGVPNGGRTDEREATGDSAHDGDEVAPSAGSTNKNADRGNRDRR